MFTRRQQRSSPTLFHPVRAFGVSRKTLRSQRDRPDDARGTTTAFPRLAPAATGELAGCGSAIVTLGRGTGRAPRGHQMSRASPLTASIDLSRTRPGPHPLRRPIHCVTLRTAALGTRKALVDSFSTGWSGDRCLIGARKPLIERTRSAFRNYPVWSVRQEPSGACESGVKGDRRHPEHRVPNGSAQALVDT